MAASRAWLVGWSVLSLALGSLVGCSGGDSGRPVYRSGVTASVEVSGLPDTQLKQICDSLDVYVDTEINFDAIAYIACLPPAIVLGGGPAGCETQLDQCMQRFPQPIAVEAQLKDQQVCFADLRQCQATVSALENCVNVNLDLALDVLDWSCSGAGDSDLQRAAARAMDTASVCGQVDASCERFINLSPE